jgi:AcrR family transcriptional regulator
MVANVADAAQIDGRTARAERTRVAVAEAMLDLIGEGDLRPTAQRVAERAGVSLRAVFHHYADMETLLAVAADRQFERLSALMRPAPRTGSLERRIDALVAERARVHEAVTPVRRAAVLSEPFSPEISRRLGWIRARDHREIEEVFATELAPRKPADRRELADAMAMATSWPAWEALRAHQALSVAQARRVVTRTVRALLKED